MALTMPQSDAAVLKRRSEIVATLKRIVPDEGVIDSDAAMRPFESDGLTGYHNPVGVVEPGVTNLAVSVPVEAAGFYYAPDPSSQIACTIGGNVAENSGGGHFLKYGTEPKNRPRSQLGP